MKKEIYLTTVAIIVLAVCAAAPVKAQSSSRATFLANMPFEFTVGNTVLPAGDYVIVCTNPSSDQKVLEFRSKDGRAFVLVQMHAVIGTAPDNAKLVFNRYGGKYFFRGHGPRTKPTAWKRGNQAWSVRNSANAPEPDREAS
jgi:hypothetical protein